MGLMEHLIYFKSYYIIEINQNGDINVKLVLGNKIKYSIGYLGSHCNFIGFGILQIRGMLHPHHLKSSCL